MIPPRLVNEKKGKKKFHLISTFEERVYKKRSFLLSLCPLPVCSRERARTSGQGPKAAFGLLGSSHFAEIDSRLIDRRRKRAQDISFFELCKEEVCTTCHLLCFLY